MTHEIKQNQTMEWIRKNYIIIAFIVTSITMWTTLVNKVDSHSDEIRGLRAVDTVAAASNSQILVELSGIRADLVWLKNNLNK